MEHPSLQQFITHARSKGMDHQTIRMLLISAGWKERDVLTAMSEESLDMPLPMPEDRGGAREAFLHLVAFASLYASLVSVLVLLFQYLNRLFPDVAFDGTYFGQDGNESMVRWFLAMLIVSFPLFAWMSRLILRDIKRSPERAWSPVRRWLTYLTLFVAAGVLVGDGITLLYYLLEGEISIRFILKVLVVLAVGGMTFGYYFLALKAPKSEASATKLHRAFAAPAWVCVLATIVAGFFITGSPSSQRLVRLDEVRVRDLGMIQSEIYMIVYGNDRYTQPTIPYTTLPKPLPTTLQDVVAEAEFNRPVIVDPATGEQYRYEVDGTDFRLCATFDTVLNEPYNIFWNHPVGPHCYEFDALDPVSK